MNVGKAHQRKIREERAKHEAEENLFGAYWNDFDIDIKKAVVKKIDNRTAKNIILEYEWLGSMPASAMYCYGIYFDGALAGAEVFGGYPDANMFSSYDWVKSAIHIHRGACVHWAHKHSATKLLSSAIKDIHKKHGYEVFTATVDSEAGEIGTIYQAANFYFLGQIGKDGHGRFIVDGKEIHPRTLYSMHKTSAREKIKDIYGDRVVILPPNHKSWYIYFVGKNKNKHKESVKELIKPYPKRRKAK